jgi:redox-sensitive bicupin YhaK (pirin superfamily)
MGDVQWMTAGSGLQHCEMFPLLNKDRDNPAELFQVWLNLPKARKFADPHFKMLWNEHIPHLIHQDENNKAVDIKVIAGNIGTITALSPAPDSYAAEKESDVAIWIIKMDPGARWQMPPANRSSRRNLYFYRGDSLKAGGKSIPAEHSFEVKPDVPIQLENGASEGYIFMLQGKPIDEPVAQYGPFVMNTDAEIRQAFADYRSTHFGGWPWDRSDHVHPRETGRFASYRDGSMEKP